MIATTGVTFGEKHSYDDWGLIMTDKEIGMPSPNTETVTVIGHNGAIDLTEALSDEITYGNRTITYTFQMVHSISLWASLISDVANYLHGKSIRIVNDDDPNYYYYGRCTVDRYTSNSRIGTLVIKCDAYPYKIETASESSGEWEWDPFSFVDGVIYTTYVEVDGEITVDLINDAMVTSPTFTCSAAMTVTFDGTDYEVDAGTTTVTDIRLQEGDNYVTFTGTGTVSISYLRGSL